MTTQLRLVEPEPVPPKTASSQVRPKRRSTKSAAQPPAPVHPIRWLELDDKTCERGLAGVAKARAALREANRRAAIRDAQRRAAKTDELAEYAARAQKSRSAKANTKTNSGPEVPHGPDGHAAA